MINVMIVEDESIMRLALQTLINWEQHGYRIVYEASNGRQALDYLHEHTIVDIVITDIKMPVMDGFQLIAEIKQLPNPQPHIVILSTYDDFAMAREAMKFRVEDYILKSELDEEPVLQTMNRIRAKLLADRQHERQALSKRQAELALLKQQVLHEWLEYGRSISMDTARIDELELRAIPRLLSVALVRIEEFDLIKQRNNHSLGSFTQSVLQAIHQVLNEEGEGEVISLTPHEYAILLFNQEGSYLHARQKHTKMLEHILFYLKEYLNLKVRMGISEVRERIEDLPFLNRQARHHVDLAFIWDQEKLIYPEFAKQLLEKDGKSLIGKEGHLLHAVHNGDAAAAELALHELFSTIKYASGQGIEHLKIRYMELYMILMNEIRDQQLDPIEILGDEADSYPKLQTVESLTSLNKWISTIVQRLISHLNAKSQSTNRSVMDAQSYIRQHYHEDITLRRISEVVQLSESHFSFLFSKHTGETFKEFLTRVRMEQAIKLINQSNLKIYEIVEKTGYTSAEHFSRTFKKTYGVSPNQYMKR